MLSARKRRPSWIATRLTLDTSKARAAAIASLDLGGTSSRERESSRGERKSARESSSGERRSARERLNHRITDAERAVRGVLTDFDAEQRIARKKGRRKLTKRDHLYLGLNSPSSSCWALLVALLLTLATLAAAVSYAFSTIEGRVAAAPNTFRALDALYAFIFTSEVLLRLIAAPSWRQMVTPLVVLEAICLVPLYARLCFGPGDIYADADAAASVPAWMRYFDALGPLRLLKLARYYSDAALLGVALRRSFSALMVPLSFMAMLCLCFASVLYAIEARPVDASADAGSSTARVANVPDAIWLMLITMTTVGYGDFYPTTPIGRLVVSCAALCGVVIIAMPLAIIGHNFNEVRAARNRTRQVMLCSRRVIGHRTQRAMDHRTQLAPMGLGRWMIDGPIAIAALPQWALAAG